ncbi:hypothetical protein BJ165DRAFT_1484254 [Panaeolus papilionaceus]|nr:hypothetical protein BJ165DRAFT_1484254 [Panaeolus papilionaceus]
MWVSEWYVFHRWAQTRVYSHRHPLGLRCPIAVFPALAFDSTVGRSWSLCINSRVVGWCIALCIIPGLDWIEKLDDAGISLSAGIDFVV